jgi:predicted transcriptional regulator
MANERVLSLRLDDAVGEELDLVAQVDGLTISDVLRAALRAHLRQRKADAGFQAAVEAYLDRQRQILLGDRQ